MKLNNYLLIVIWGLSFNTFAQTKPEPEFNEKTLISMFITFPDTSNAMFFNKNPEVNHIILLFKDREPQFLFISYDSLKAPNPIVDRYDMLFEGDVYLLMAKHGPINFLVPTLTGHYEGKNMPLPYHRDHLFTTIKRDSIIYNLWPGEEIASDVVAIGTPPKYAGDLGKLEEEVKKALTKNGSKNHADSIVVFEGIVGAMPTNSLSELTLIAGRESVFSNLIKAEFAKETNLWYPADIGGPVKSRVKIYARLNFDGSVKIKTTPKQLTYDAF